MLRLRFVNGNKDVTRDRSPLSSFTEWTKLPGKQAAISFFPRRIGKSYERTAVDTHTA